MRDPKCLADSLPIPIFIYVKITATLKAGYILKIKINL
jgi:hypothetical protein